ncbi:MAG: hypothetical protein WCZ90_16730 [Melioribacteraceae bacterium]
MKKTIILFALLSVSIMNAQFRDDLNKSVDVKSGIFNKESALSPFGLLGIEDFQMKHSFGLSYSAFGSGGGMALGTYTNSMLLKFSDKLNMQADISILNSPYSSFGQDFAKQINGIYLSRLQMNYKVSENMSVILQYRSSPFGYYNPYYSNGFFSGSRDYFFGGDEFGKE